MKKLVMLLATALLVFGLSGTSMAVVFNGSDYQIVNGAITWTNAKTAAEALGAGWHLVTITSQAEQDFIADTLLQGLEGQGQYWAGASQTPGLAQGGLGWNWVTGEAWGYTSWAPGSAIQPISEPNDYGGADEIYLALDGRWVRNWTWNDGLTTEGILGYVAEGPAPVPEPGTMMLLGSGLVGLAGYGRRRMKK